MSTLAGWWVHNKTGNEPHLRPWSAEEISNFFDMFQRTQPTASLFHETLEWAVEAKRRVPACNVVYRHYIDPARGFTEGNVWRIWNAQQHLDEFMPFARPGLILNIWNECNPDKSEMPRFAEVAASVMDAFGKEGQPTVIWQPSVGTPHEGSDTIELLEPLWEAFDRWYDLHIMGWHEYGTHRGMLFSEPNGAHNVYPWRVGRAVDLIHPQVVAIGHKGFRLLFTEFGADYAFDGQGHKRGYRDYWGGKKYGQEVVSAIERTKRPYVLGYCIYKKGNSSGWGDFDTLNDTDFDKEIETGTKDGRLAPVVIISPPTLPVPIPPAPIPLDPPLPVDLGAPINTRVSGANWRIRSEPTTSAPAIGTLIEGEEIRLYPATATLADGESWKVVERVLPVVSEARKGWSAIPTPAQPPPPSSPTLLQAERDMQRIASIHAEMAVLEMTITEANAALARLRAEIATLAAKYPPLRKSA